MKDRCWVRNLEYSWQIPHILPAALHPPLPPKHKHMHLISDGCWTVNVKKKKKPEGKAHFESDLLRHSFCLVSQHHRITVTASFLARVFPQLKFLHGRERRNPTLVCLIYSFKKVELFFPYCCKSLVHFRPSLLHSRFLNEATSQLTVVLRNPGCSLFHHFPLLRRWCLRKRTFQLRTRPDKVCVCLCTCAMTAV